MFWHEKFRQVRNSFSRQLTIVVFVVLVGSYGFITALLMIFDYLGSYGYEYSSCMKKSGKSGRSFSGKFDNSCFSELVGES